MQAYSTVSLTADYLKSDEGKTRWREVSPGILATPDGFLWTLIKIEQGMRTYENMTDPYGNHMHWNQFTKGTQ